jgi:hypothetical protein
MERKNIEFDHNVDQGKSLEIEDKLEKIVLAQQTQGQTSTSVVVYDEADDAAPVEESGGTAKLKCCPNPCYS